MPPVGRCCRALRFSADRAARLGPHTRGKPRLLDVGRRIPARNRFAPDSPLQGTGFEPSVPPPNIRHSDVPHRFSNGSDSDWPPGRKAALSAPVARLARIKTTGRSAWSHAGVSAYAFAVFTRRIARLRVSGARATVWGSRTRRSRERSVCKLRPVWSCVARHSNETRALRLPGPRHPS